MATLLIRADPAAGASPNAPRDAPHGSEGGPPLSLPERLRWATVCLGFLALTLSSQPGRIVPDTKLDLTIDPWGWLDRALTLWEPEGFAGEVQNQAYGYLFPMGPFFGLAQSVGVPGWVAQRLWMALLLSLAFLGVGLLARQLRIGTPTSQLIGALAYALAPRMLMGLGATSIEVLPMALAPWVLIPLVAGARGGSPRRAAALSGLAVFCVGGVNAVATSAVLPLAVLWLLTRPAGPRRRRLLGWWIGAVGLATAWWAGPLLLLGRYSPPFLDYIETAAVTTSPTGLLSTLRGTTQWVAYLVDGRGPVWPTGWTLVHDVLPVLATVLLAAVGLLGLAWSRLPERAWLVLGLLAGLALVTMGHLGAVQGLLAGPLHDALDGVLAPMRNVHKFDPVLRLPLALGVVHLTGLLLVRARRPGRLRVRALARVGVLAVVLALVTTVSPALAGRLSPPTGFESIPEYWEETADYLAGAQPEGRALLLPASSFGTYIWGTTSDEPMQALADSPWTVRSAIPLSATAHIRMLNAVEERLARGEGSAGLAGYLARAGISHLVVRNDLDNGAVGSTRPILVQQALRDSPGIRRVATFGPLVPAQSELFGRILDSYLQPPRPAVEVYEVADPAPRAWTTPLADAVSVVGGPDGLLALEDRGLVTGRPALLVDGETAPTGPAFVSDAQLRRERAYGRTGDAVSAGLTADQPRRLDGPERDYAYPGSGLAESVVRIDGATVSAASSASDADSVGGVRVGDQPYAAIDGDMTTAWRPANRLDEPQRVWWRIDTNRPIRATEIVLRLAADADSTPPARLRISTDGGARTVALADTTDVQRFRLPAGDTSSLTIEVPGVTTADLALAEVEIPGLDVGRTVVTPAPAGAVLGYAFDAAHPATAGCATENGGRPRCSPALVATAEEPAGLDRVVTVVRPAEYGVTVTAVPRAGAALDALIAAAVRPGGPVVEASSVAVPDPRAGADAALDGNPRTTWVAAEDDDHPTLTLTWPEPRTIDSVVVGLAPGTAASLVTAVGISANGLEQTVGLDVGGRASFAPVTTDRLVLSFPLRRERTSYDPYTRRVETLGPGISELGIAGVDVGDRAATVDIPCGQGPVVSVDGEQWQTAVHTTVAGLRSLRPVPLELCGGGATTGRLAAGEHRFVALGTDTFTVRSATLLTDGAAATSPVERDGADVGQWDREHRTLRVAARSEPTLLVVPESVNPGWVAMLDGQELRPQTVDGWQQGYVLPAGPAGEVVLDFRAGAVYHAALAVGAVAVLALIVLLLVPGRGTPPPPTGSGRSAGVAVVLAAVGGIALVGGWWGLGLLAAMTGLAWAVRRRAVLAALAAGALLTAGGVFLTLSGDGARAVVQLLALTAVSAVVAALLTGRAAGFSGTTVRHRRIGRSTSR